MSKSVKAAFCEVCEGPAELEELLECDRCNRLFATCCDPDEDTGETIVCCRCVVHEP